MAPRPWVPRPLPEPLPEGEEILWRAGPLAWPLAVRVFHIRKIAVYFAALVLWLGASTYVDKGSITGALVAALWVVPLALAAIGILGLFAWLVRRTTTYTITSRRLILQYGVAFPMTLNLPFKHIGSAALRLYRDGSGDIPVTLTDGTKIAYPVLWPHARPWRVRRTEPMLRVVADAKHVAEILARAILARRGTERPQAAAGSDQETTDTPDLPQTSSAAA
ncbi:MAG: PH domain-containing protein [Rhodoplanes sp.]|uniref:photosynthetic complex putative assembly protein PuhB n=1 Tax=Rhodoplanes sp. TaxID=1968906 RepID=UPI00182BB54E|nr:photosynthetic complex putative assembly protein PuhB [Rhodoplanes sp.]NVO16859.1 PH domain-containing protein [Rhodoplanes sp.]